MTDDERDRVAQDATEKADTKNRLANVEKKVNFIERVAYGVGAWVGVKILEWITNQGGNGQ